MDPTDQQADVSAPAAFDIGDRHWPELLSDLARRLDESTSAVEIRATGGNHG